MTTYSEWLEATGLKNSEAARNAFAEEQANLEQYGEYLEAQGIEASSEAWMAYCEWRQAGNEMA